MGGWMNGRMDIEIVTDGYLAITRVKLGFSCN